MFEIKGVGESNGTQSTSEINKTNKEANVKKQRRRKSSSSSRAVKSKAKYVEGQSKPRNIEVA